MDWGTFSLSSHISNKIKPSFTFEALLVNISPAFQIETLNNLFDRNRVVVVALAGNFCTRF